MENHESHCGCGCSGFSRRSFLAAGCTTCAGVLGTSSGLLTLKNAARADDGNGNMKIRVLFALHAAQQAVPDWPNIGYDFVPIMDRTVGALTRGCPGIDFIPTMVSGKEATEKVIAEDAAAKNIDGYLVMQMNCWNQVVQTAVTTGKPVLFADFLYAGSGGFLAYTAGQIRAKTPNFAFISSSRVRDLVAAARCFSLVKEGKPVEKFAEAVADVRRQRTAKAEDMTCIEDKCETLGMEELFKELKTKKIIEVEKGWVQFDEGYIKNTFGIETIRIPFSELNDFWEKADREEAKKIVERWKKTAEEIIGIPEETLEASARMYLAQKECMKKHDACAITINCLGGFYGNHIHAYPCLGFHELLNEGLIGACECDNRSTLTMVVMTALTKGRPGYISDPVVDIATRQIIYAHCVASNKAFGPDGPENPFTILTHSEDRSGASLRSTLPVGYMTTTVEFAPERKEILFHQAKAVANNKEDRACRTKLAAVPVGDFEKIFTEWDRWGWHRVTYYGDLKEPVFALAKAIGWTVVEEA
ncbi:MAG: hypothetical protein FWC50_14170 [Planctomycetaceae bacterium]|nr:hypothetical protein [Planctomycetaceae bacterium]